jgi:CpeT/CpcT family (DUF1001)
MAEGRRALARALAAAVLAAVCACSDEGKLREVEQTQLLALLPGHYDNSAQAEADARSGAHPAHEKIALVIARTYTPRIGHHVLYAQEMAADDPRRVLSQKMYSFELDPKRGIVETVYQFAEPRRWRDGVQNPELFTGVVAEDVRAEGCQLLWKKTEAGFTAAHDPKVCPDPRGAAAGPQAELGVDSLSIGDYRFRKTR